MAERYDLLITSVGYEARSRYIAEIVGTVAARKVAFNFDSPGVLSFDQNLRVVRALGFEVRPIDDQFAGALRRLLEDATDQGVRAIGIDISSLTKFHIAEVVDVFHESNLELSVDFLYAPASSASWVPVDAPIQYAEPIHPAFASWTDDPLLPLVAVIGTGAEANLALGVAEQLDVSGVYAFSPSGADAEFDRISADANHDFFLANYVVRSSTYDLLAPFELFSRLESLLYGLTAETRIALVPLGPKIFALCSLLASLASGRAATVWRFSFGVAERPADVQAAGVVVSLRVTW
ncbi:hypothetical protein [Frigoribacterium faeni]|uniref:hypothetical protein n=1 Tax=Frigoribacterium faeni TaxID=145483 RepID=UPI00141B6F66|nr:hypothetical protein [Frigoribacterium faeni]NIJ05905.1 hypothetical protein [Frigoribacterium faeni]